MRNWRLIFKVIGMLLFIEAGMLFISLGVVVYYGEKVLPFLLALAASLVLGGWGLLCGKNAGKSVGRRDGYVIVSLSWIIFTLVGMIPFVLSRSLPNLADAFFESMSGFTSTGATVIDEVDPLPKGILFWRSMTQWIGGIGIIFFTIAILPAFGVGEVKLFAAEATGPLQDKVSPRISVAVKWIGSVYLGLTVACIASLVASGMGWFDAINISMTTAATGGFAPHSAFLHDLYNSPQIEYVLTAFMLFSGMNYTLLFYTFLKGRFKKFFLDNELKCYLIIVFGCTAVCTTFLTLSRGNGDIELAFRESIFTIVSMQTTTGLANCDYNLWPQMLMPFIVFVMFAGACSGSTSGGFKCIRITILWQVLKSEFLRILHPRAVIAVKVNGNVIPPSIQRTLLAFITLFVCSLFIGALILCLFGLGAKDACSLALASLSNVGPTIGYFGPAHSFSILAPEAKVVCSLLMLIGRLEIFPIFIIFTRSFWKED